MRLLIAVLSFVLHGACSPSPPAIHGEPTAEDSTSHPVPSGSSAGTARPVRTAAPAASSFAETFVCGRSRCAAQSETCCGAHPDGVCVPSSSDKGASGAVGSLAPQIEACDRAVMPLGVSLTGIDRCGESIDCAAGEVCCRDFLHSGSDISQCVKKLPGDKSPCDYGERCYDADGTGPRAPTS